MICAEVKTDHCNLMFSEIIRKASLLMLSVIKVKKNKIDERRGSTNLFLFVITGNVI